MDPNISKETTGKERVVTTCAESQSTSRGPNRTRFVDSTGRNTRQENAVDLCGEDNADVKHQCLEKGQTIPTNMAPV
jgi:hypothetical protein